MSKRKTAKELMDELEKNPEYQRMRAEKDEKQRKREEVFAIMRKPILDDLKSAGFEGKTIQGIVKSYAPLPQEVVEILLHHLKLLLEEKLNFMTDKARIAESVVRALGATRIPFNGQVLVECFEQTSDEGLKWAAVNTIAIARPHSIDDWLIEINKSPYWSKTLHELGGVVGNDGKDSNRPNEQEENEQ